MIKKNPANSGRAPARMSGDTRCVEAISALANGTLAGWRGVPDGCTRTDVEKVLSLVTREANESSPYSGPLTYAPTPGAANGLTVHYAVGAVEYITVVEPQFKQPIEEMLGEPEGRLPSHLEGASEQWVYPGLGLAFHMKSGEPGVSWLYVFRPTTLEGFRTSMLSRVRTLRHRERSTEEL